MGMFDDLHKQDLADKAKRADEQANKQALKQESKQATLQANNKDLKQASEEETNPPIVRPAPFDITREPYATATFRFTDPELDALEDLKIDLKRKFDLKTTKQNLVRYALYRLVEDYTENGEESWLVTRLKNK